MKKLIPFFLVLFVVFAGLRSRAQSFEGGILVGPVTSQINGDGYGGFHQLGLTAGVFGRIPGKGASSWQMELKYSLFGAHSDSKEVQMGMNPMNIRLHYVELPMMYRYKLSKHSINGFSLGFITLEIGLSGDFLAKNTQSANSESGVENPSWLFFSVTGNVGLHFDLGEHLGINIRSMNSITPCRWRPESPSVFYGHYYNIALQAALTYTFKAAGH